MVIVCLLAMKLTEKMLLVIDFYYIKLLTRHVIGTIVIYLWLSEVSEVCHNTNYVIVIVI